MHPSELLGSKAQVMVGSSPHALSYLGARKPSALLSQERTTDYVPCVVLPDSDGAFLLLADLNLYLFPKTNPKHGYNSFY